MSEKLVIWDPAWLEYAEAFRQRLGTEWLVTAESNNINWLKRELKDATALLAVKLPIEALPYAKNLRIFLYPGAGLLDDDPHSIPDGCPVVNVFEHEVPIAEYVFMAMLMHATQIRTYAKTFSQGRWDGSGRVGGTPHGEIAGKTIGLFGYGRIAKAIATRARAFGMRVAAISRSGCTDSSLDFAGSPSDLDTLLQQSDFLIISAPLSDETRGIIGARELALLPSGAFVINVSRGPIIDEDSLYDALNSGIIGGAALDVWYQYPDLNEVQHGSSAPFHKLPNVLCTPHYSAWTLPMIFRRIDRMTANLRHLINGEPLERLVLRGTWRP